jgi:anti-anti-sigma factor
MRLDTEQLDGGILKIKLKGRLDIAGSEQIGVPLAALVATDNRRLILDLSAVEFIASIGVRMILQNARAHHLRGGILVLMAPPPLIEEVLQTAGVPNVVPVVADLAAARTALVA